MSSKKKMSLEEYLRFLHSDREGRYTANLLNQIVSLHGFRRIKGKTLLSDTVKTMELTYPARSTLNENVSSRAFLKLEEVVADLDAIKWMECCIIGTQTLSSKPDPQEDSVTDISISHPREITRVAKSKSQPRTSAREEKANDPNAPTAGGGTSPSAASTTINAPPPSKKKKKFSAPLSSSN